MRNLRFISVGLMEMLSNGEAPSPSVRASGEETCDMVVPAMKVRGFNFTEVTTFPKKAHPEDRVGWRVLRQRTV